MWGVCKCVEGNGCHAGGVARSTGQPSDFNLHVELEPAADVGGGDKDDDGHQSEK